MDIVKRAGHKSPDITMIYARRYSNKDEIIAEEPNGMMKIKTDSYLLETIRYLLELIVRLNPETRT